MRQQPLPNFSEPLEIRWQRPLCDSSTRFHMRVMCAIRLFGEERLHEEIEVI